MDYYILGCMFTERLPEVSQKIRAYIENRYDMKIVRCCVPGWKVKEHEEKMPNIWYDEWKTYKQSEVFVPEDRTWSVCPNCVNIIDEWRRAESYSLWELIAQDKAFPFPDYSGMKVTLQDCFRIRDRKEIQDAVRYLLYKMNIEYVEAEKNHDKADFCGKTLYKPQIERNPKLAPKHYKENTEGLFLEHSEDEQNAIMKEYCKQYKTDTVICYCHYCLDGLIAGGVDGKHIAELLFG